MGRPETRRSSPPPPLIFSPFSKEIPYERGLRRSWVEPPELRRQATTQAVVIKAPAREGHRSGIMGRGRRQTQMGQVRRAARFRYASPLSAPSPSPATAR